MYGKNRDYAVTLCLIRFIIEPFSNSETSMNYMKDLVLGHILSDAYGSAPLEAKGASNSILSPLTKKYSWLMPYSSRINTSG